jgi:hypothetical protein
VKIVTDCYRQRCAEVEVDAPVKADAQ